MGTTIRNFFRKPFRWAICYACLLTAFFLFTLLDAFLIPKVYAQVTPLQAESQDPVEQEETLAAHPPVTAEVGDTTYRDEKIQIELSTLRVAETTVYVADVRIAEASLLRTALARNTYGRNMKETTSAMAEEHGAILAINGDYYGFRDTGYVLRNGVVYRDLFSGDALLFDAQGDLTVLDEAQDLEALAEQGAWQVFSFGPALVEEGQVAVSAQSEVAQSKTSNPRTAIGQVDTLHYIFVVSDGRTEESSGLSLLDLAEVLVDFGCHTAYNLDGGGSSTMVFQGQVVNQTTNGRRDTEREVSDIVYIGYP